MVHPTRLRISLVMVNSNAKQKSIFRLLIRYPRSVESIRGNFPWTLNLNVKIVHPEKTIRIVKETFILNNRIFRKCFQKQHISVDENRA